MFDKADGAKYQKALKELARQIALMVREDYPNERFENILDYLADYTCETHRELDEEIQGQLKETDKDC